MLHSSRTVPAGIVICQRNHIQSLDGGHAHEIGRGHVIVAARRQAGMHMKIIIQGNHDSSS